MDDSGAEKKRGGFQVHNEEKGVFFCRTADPDANSASTNLSSITDAVVKYNGLTRLAHVGSEEFINDVRQFYINLGSQGDVRWYLFGELERLSNWQSVDQV